MNLLTYIALCIIIAVDDLFKEANVGRDGLVRYEEFTRMVTLPPVDY